MRSDSCMALARSVAVKVAFLSRPCARPRSVCERMTPELPRAPNSAPCASFAAITPAAVSLLAAMSRVAACIVLDMLEPVSPSGTGKTLRALMASLCSSSHAAPAIMAFFRSCPSKTLMRRVRCRVRRDVCSCILLRYLTVEVSSKLFFAKLDRWVVNESLNIDVDLGDGNAQHLLDGEFYAAHNIMRNFRHAQAVFEHDIDLNDNLVIDYSYLYALIPLLRRQQYCPAVAQAMCGKTNDAIAFDDSLCRDGMDSIGQNFDLAQRLRSVFRL